MKFCSKSVPARMRTVIVVLLCGLTIGTSAMAEEKVMRIAMTLVSIPRTNGQADQGFEGIRFASMPVFESLTQWDLSRADKPSGLVPGLAASWKVDERDKRKWIFKLRSDVRFHDGSAFNADAVVWNVRKFLDRDAPHYDPIQERVSIAMPTLRSARKIDDYTVELTTQQPDAFLPYNLVNLFMASPAHWAKKLTAVPPAVTAAAERSRLAWQAFSGDASGTGPFRMAALVSLTLAEGLRIQGADKTRNATYVVRERLELVRNPNYWDVKRRAKIDRIILLPIPEAEARTSALMAGQVDWVEAPPLSSLDMLRNKGFKVYANLQPHVWPWMFSFVPGSPWLDKRVRQAANQCVDRAALKRQLGDMMEAATGTVEAGHPWRGKPQFQIGYAPAAARELMQQAGYTESRPARIKVQIAASGSGQMMPVLMNEIVRRNLAQCFFDVQFDVIEWNTLNGNRRVGAKDASAHGSNAANISFSTMDPYFAMVRFVETKAFPPASENWGFYSNPKVDAIIGRARTSFDEKSRDAVLAELHAALVDDAAFLWVAHDVGPRVMSGKIKGVVQPKNWYIDFAPMSVD